MNNINVTARRIFSVLLSNAIMVFSSIIVGFIIPNIISIEGYGYYKSFTLYTTYASLLSFGLIDGIVVKYGEYDYDDLNREKFRLYFKCFAIINFLSALVIASISFLIKDNNLSYICLVLSVNIFVINICNYYQQISQITLKIKQYSLRRILTAVFNIVAVISMYILYRFNLYSVDYKLYILMVSFINIFLAIWYVYTYRDISFGKSESLLSSNKEILELIRCGLPLLFANMSSTIIMNLDRQFVNIFFSKEEYAIYAFAYSMFTLITVATSAAYTVLYPTLKRLNNTSISSSYYLSSKISLIFVLFMIASYFPLTYVVRFVVPKYEASLDIFRIVFPGLAISSSVTVIMRSYYKVMNKNLDYLKKCLIVIGLSIVLNCIVYIFFHNTSSISIASIFVMFIWYLLCESDLVKQYQIKNSKNLCYLIICIMCFYITSIMNNAIMGCFLYLMLYVVVTILFFKNNYMEMKNMIFTK